MSWFINVKIAVFAPIPSASDSTATALNIGDFRKPRRANCKSLVQWSICDGLSHKDAARGETARGAARMKLAPKARAVLYGQVQVARQNIGQFAHGYLCGFQMIMQISPGMRRAGSRWLKLRPGRGDFQYH